MLSMASVAFFMGNIWNTCHSSVHTSSRQGTAACTSRSRRRMESDSRISLVPAWIRVGGKPLKSPKRGENSGRLQSCPGAYIVEGEHRVDVGPLLVGLAAGGHVRPGGEEDQGPGEPPPGVLEQVGEHQGQVAPGGVARDDNVPRTVAHIH